ncbi:MAG: menaquinol oxidoreductase [Deferrisomatales bacterium]
MGWTFWQRPAAAGPAERLRGLEARASLGLWALVLFCLLSLWAGRGFVGVPAAPESWRELLGRPPPPSWVSAALVVYLFSALVLGLTRMAGGSWPFAGFRHLGYLAAFYGFYYVGDALEDNYWAVLVGGFAVLGLEGYRHWLALRPLIQEERERLRRSGP